MSVWLSLQVPPFDVFDRKGPHPHETPSRDLGIYPFHLLFQVLQIQWDKLTWLFWIPSCLKVVLSCSIYNTPIRKVKPKGSLKSQPLPMHMKQEVKLCKPMQQVNRCGWHWLLLQLHLLISGGNLMLNDHVLQKRSKVKISGKSC